MCIPCCSDCEAHGWFFLVWRLLWCCDLPCVQRLHLLNFSEGSLCTCIVLTHDAQNFRWIRLCWFQVLLDSRNFPKMQAFGLFRGRMSSWCSFRCTCLDELESKSDVNILHVSFWLRHVCIPCYSDCEAHGWFFLVWRLLWCCDLVHDKMVVLTIDQQQFRWIRCCWFQASLDSIFFFKMQAFGLFRGRMSSSWPLPGQNVSLVFIQTYVSRLVAV